MRQATPFTRAAWACAAALVGFGTPESSQAMPDPFYGRVLAVGDMGSVIGQNVQIDAGARAVFAAEGQFWCPESGWGCSVSIAAGAGGGAALAWVDPFAGTIRAKAGAFNYPADERVHWTVQLPGTNPFEYYPVYWQAGEAQTYMRTTWQITSDTLPVGAPVTVDARLDLGGELLGGPTTGFSAAMLLNRSSDAQQWLQFGDYISYGTALDLLGNGMADGRTVSATGAADGSDVAVDASLPWSKTFAVGDVLVAETMLNTFAGAPNIADPDSVAENLYYYWAQFDQTLRSNITVSTAGAMLVPVPEPSTWALWLAGIVSLASLAMRRGWQA